MKLAPFGRVLELACGTGWWTQVLAANATSVTAVDAAQEMLAINRQRVASPNVDYVLADAFSWRPAHDYDLVFFSAWLSHVPRDRFEPFFLTVRQSLAPSGQVFFIDQLEAGAPVEKRVDGDIVLRTLDDGRKFRAVKVFYPPSELEARLQALGWEVVVKPVGPELFYGRMRPSS